MLIKVKNVEPEKCGSFRCNLKESRPVGLTSLHTPTCPHLTGRLDFHIVTTEVHQSGLMINIASQVVPQLDALHDPLSASHYTS